MLFLLTRGLRKILFKFEEDEKVLRCLIAELSTGLACLAIGVFPRELQALTTWPAPSSVIALCICSDLDGTIRASPLSRAVMKYALATCQSGPTRSGHGRGPLKRFEFQAS
ncbi:hypothetical protein P153DRAFT_188942 [Dothidotthia symphoricarpi CBS 119687]|uniref:Uncharacterized protein n=1 Tax=Dothidotthia symphoricarpi CBS 119687 TaxID=1392245 RepID=A0A6A6AN15_9PLEO|nr:uncharacterized protein P153DRAFT_188942 [Dothidotthia symphoricarpi CBS 119687]KAF2132324.1 hypothetical protein P153DRAFT_188942 [Dothidotthia symphoricarpi CBS 119687]